MKRNEHLAMSRFDFCGLINHPRTMGTNLAKMIVAKKKSILNNGAFSAVKMEGGRVNKNGGPNGSSWSMLGKLPKCLRGRFAMEFTCQSYHLDLGP